MNHTSHNPLLPSCHQRDSCVMARFSPGGQTENRHQPLLCHYTQTISIRQTHTGDLSPARKTPGGFPWSIVPLVCSAAIAVTVFEYTDWESVLLSTGLGRTSQELRSNITVGRQAESRSITTIKLLNIWKTGHWWWNFSAGLFPFYSCLCLEM